MNTKIIKLDEVNSTNSYLHDYVDGEQHDITIVTARHQTAGRGQGTNKWSSEKGVNLLFSILVHPVNVPITSQFLLSMAEALSLYDVLTDYTEGISLKWPNDVYWHDKKISGTLIETAIAGGRLKNVIFGSGININQRSFDASLPNPVSLFQILGHETSTDEVFDKIVERFKHYYTIITNGGYAEISTSYHQVLYRRHGFFRFKDEDGEFEGALVEVEDDGHLILRDREGKIRSYAFKEVEYII